MKPLALGLLIFGVVVLIYGGIGYNRQRTVFKVGDIKATATEHKSFPIAPAAGVLAIIVGIAMLANGRRGA